MLKLLKKHEEHYFCTVVLDVSIFLGFVNNQILCTIKKGVLITQKVTLKQYKNCKGELM